MRSLDGLMTALAENRITEAEFVTMFCPLYEPELRSPGTWITDPGQQVVTVAVYARITGTDGVPAGQGLAELVRERMAHG